jgi:hypothetical protein
LGGINARTIELLQIGDIHYNSADLEKPLADIKDKCFSDKLVGHMRMSEFSYIIKELLNEPTDNVCALLICGDLSTYGLIEGYKNCLSFLNQRLMRFYNKFGKGNVLIAPGNHDIARENYSDNSVYPKFDPMSKALKECDFSDVPVLVTKNLEFKDQFSDKITIVMINSCIGCGERRYYHEKIREIIPRIVSSGSIEEFEDLDTPMFWGQCIDDIMHDTDLADDKNLPIILTHHNLLTMKKNRVAMYTELINSGSMRESLLSLGKPILYLHGHIHDNPIEIIQSSRFEDAKIISISAPLLVPSKLYKDNKFGYNRIKIVFNGGNVPIGCEIIQHEFLNGSHKKHESKIRFWNPPKTFALASERSKCFLNLIEGEQYLSELLLKANGSYEAIYTEMDIVESIEELSWLGLVDYKKNKPATTGVVRKVVQ